MQDLELRLEPITPCISRISTKNALNKVGAVSRLGAPGCCPKSYELGNGPREEHGFRVLCVQNLDLNRPKPLNTETEPCCQAARYMKAAAESGIPDAQLRAQGLE